MPAPQPRAILFDVFGTVVDWRGSLIADLAEFGRERGLAADWASLVDAWRGAYAPSLDRVRRGELPWTRLDDLHRASLLRLLAEHRIAGLDDASVEEVNRLWHRLAPWPDAVAGLMRLKRRFIIGTLSNGNMSLLVDMAKQAGLPWDVVFGGDVFRHYKPDPEVYLGAAALLDLRPEQVMLCAAHNGDLRAARGCGLQTAFVPRPGEYGPRQERDLQSEEDWDIIALDFLTLAEQLDCIDR